MAAIIDSHTRERAMAALVMFSVALVIVVIGFVALRKVREKIRNKNN